MKFTEDQIYDASVLGMRKQSFAVDGIDPEGPPEDLQGHFRSAAHEVLKLIGSADA